MKPTIEALWDGNVASAENCGVGDPEIEKLVTLIERHKDRLSEELWNPQKEIFEKYADCTDEFTTLLCRRAFCDGFSLACKLLSESLSSDA